MTFCNKHGIVAILLLTSVAFAQQEDNPPIPVRFTLDKPSAVSMVIEDDTGTRVRNLISDAFFPPGENVVWWDGLDDVGRDLDAAAHGVYHVPGKLVPAGAYRVRGIARGEVDLTYLHTPYFPGDPPWMTAARSSGWLANHTPPSAVCFVPAGQVPARKGEAVSPDQMLVGSYVSEGGSGLAWIGLDGRKLHGQEWVGGVWTGAQFITRDIAPGAPEDVYAYTAAYCEGDKFNEFKSELRLHGLRRSVDAGRTPKDTRFGTGEDAPILKPTFKIEVPPGVGKTPRLGGLAAFDGIIVVSLTANERLLFIDARAGQVIGQAAVASPRGVCFDPSGRLLVISGQEVLRFDRLSLPAVATTTQPTTANTPRIMLPRTERIASSLDDPRQLCLAPNGDLYVSEWGSSHQVTVFSSAGKLVRTVGRRGTPQLGPYDENQMHRPLGMAIAPDGKLWVAENDALPKRLSIWNADGSLDRAYYGPPQYGGGGSIDPVDPTRYFLANAGGIELKLDYATGASKPVAIYSRPYADGGEGDPLRVLRGDRYAAPQTPIHLNGKAYLVDSYNVSPTQGVSVSGVWLYEDGRIRPVAMVGQANEASGLNPSREFSARWEGTITPPSTGQYTFYVGSTHGSRLWVGGKPVVLNWHNWGGDTSGKIALEGGKRYDFVMEMYHRDGPARAQLAWSQDKIGRQVVPTEVLSPKKGDGRGLDVTYFSDQTLGHVAGTRVDAQINFNWGKGAAFDLKSAREMLGRTLPGVDLEKDRVVFAWSDLNEDGQVQASEVTAALGNAMSVAFQEDLSALGGSGWLLKPERFTAGGTPVFDVRQAVEMIPATAAQASPSSGGGQAAMGRNTKVLFTTAPKPFAPQSIGGTTWSYPSLWPGLHASHIAPLIDEPGRLVGTTRLLGPAIAMHGDIDLVAINGNKGVVYLFTTDGLYVTQLFNDVRRGSWNAPQAVAGMSVRDLSLGEECFYPTMTRARDGRVLLQGGGRVIDVRGLDSIRRLPEVNLRVSNADLAAAQRYFVAAEAKRQEEQAKSAVATIPLVSAEPTVDGKIDEWAKASWLTIDQRTVQVGDWGKRKLITAGAVRVAGERLYLAIKTDAADLLANRGDSLTNLFKTGGAIDLMIGADSAADPKRRSPAAGDQRVLIAIVNGKTVAVRYTPTSPGSGEPVLFSSPVRTVKIDRVDNISDAVMAASTVERDDRGAVKQVCYEVSILLSAINLSPADRESIRADLGILRGNGFQTLQRVYWSNKATGLVSDIPSEAELLPHLWGTWTFRLQ